MKIKNNKGQLSIVNLFYFVITVFIAAIMTPITTSVIQSAISISNLTAIDQLIMTSVTAFLWIAVLMTIFIYMSPTRPNQF